MTTTLDKLASAVGIASEYTDKAGQIHVTADETKLFFLKAMGVPAETEKERLSSLEYFEELPWRRMMPHTAVVLTDELPAAFILSLPADAPRTLAWHIALEDGSERQGTLQTSPVVPEETRRLDGRLYRRVKAVPDTDIPVGYHRNYLSAGDMTAAST